MASAMKRSALLVALALAPALGCNEFPAWRTVSTPRPSAQVGGAAFVGAAAHRDERMRLAPRIRAPTCGTAPSMQVQAALKDPPRFRDLHNALTGVVTRAEREAMMITQRAARVASVSHMDLTTSVRDKGWETAQLGRGVGLCKHFSHDWGEPALHSAVDQIHRATLEAVSKPWSKQEIVFSAEEVTQVRKVAHTSYLAGQRTMTKLGHLLAQRVMSSGYECRSMVTAESGNDVEEFRISQTVPLSLLVESMGSLDLAQQQLSGLIVSGNQAGLIDHAIEFEAMASNDMAVAKVIAHARPSAELWRFISDSIFDIQETGEAPKGEKKDDSMFEIKMLVESSVQADLLHRDMRLINFKDSELRDLHVPVGEDSRHVELVSQTDSKRKSKVLWQGVSMSIQVQTLDEHYMQSELSSMAARAQEEARREHVCQELERRVSLFKFSRDLLHWLFASSSMRHPPSTDRIAVKLHQ